MQHVGMDYAAAEAQDAAVAFGEAVRTALNGRSQNSLADQIGEDSGNLSKILSGKQPGSLTLEFVRRVEIATGFVARA